MDRISTLRNIEDALTHYEDGELSLPELEREVRAILRTYATEFQPDADPYRVSGEPVVDGLVVVATSRHEAREQVETFAADAGPFELERLSRDER